jgi:alkaline phosphatase
MKTSIPRSAFSRRDLLKLAGLGAAGLTAVEAPAAAAALADRKLAAPKNIIFMVSDGMSLGTLTLADPFARMWRGQGTVWYELLRRPEVALGYQDTASLNSLVTDSSAASSAWGSGSRIVNGAVNMLPDGTKLAPIGRVVKDFNRAFGLVTTTTITHATPAGFGAAHPTRGDEAGIAPQYLGVADVLFGGGSRYFNAENRRDKDDLFGKYRQAGYTVCRKRDDLAALAQSSGPVLGIFHDSHLPYTVDHLNSPRLKAEVPTLAEMTASALDLLTRRSSNGFLLQIEGGKVDHAAHANDPAGLLWDQVAFDDAIGVAIKFAVERGDTLVVITSDHGNANPGLNGMGIGYSGSTPALERLTRATGGYTTLNDRIRAAGETPTTDAIIDAVKDVMKIELTPVEADRIRLALGGETPYSINRSLANTNGVLGETFSNHFGIAWIGTAHTADLVPVTALGPGQDRFSNLHLNTDAFRHITELFGIQFKNPAMSPEQFKQLQSARRVPLSPVVAPHWI